MELNKVQLLNKESILQSNSVIKKEQGILSTTTTICNQQIIYREGDDDDNNNNNTLVERRKGTQLYLKNNNNNNNNNHNDNPTSTPQNTNNYSTNSILAQIERQNALLEKDPKSISIASNALKCHFSTVQKLVSDCHSPPPSAPPFFNSYNDDNKENSIHHHHHLNNYQRNYNHNHNHNNNNSNSNDWDFWQSLLQDPVHMTQKTPHLLSMKLRSGIPPHVRGHIWQTICQSDSLHLETVYGQLCNEHSPHERIIQRDLTRTFPNIDMFQQENGDGQLAMRRILVAYSLYDGDVGYCQGLAFLVGPLLMNMPETSAFCVFVRLMETYEMRTMFTLNMEGLQLRLYQFSCLLKEFLPKLSAHFEHHSIHAAMYASQWFLTLFAYAFPMDLVTRIYDIIFLEGAAETIMRVAIAMLQRSEHIILQEQEFEHLLDCVTTRKLCAPYNENWSLVIQETMSLSNVITKEKLNHLTDQYNQQGQQEKKKTEQVLASRLGNFWRRSRSTRRNNNNNNDSNKKKSANHPDRSSIAGPIHSIKKKQSNEHNDEKGKVIENKDSTTNELKSKKSRYSLPIDPSQLPTNFDRPPIPMTLNHQSTTTTITTTHKEFEPEAVIHELLQALEELRKEHSKTIDELFEIKMDKQDIESERDALKLTIVELERRYYTQQQSIYNTNDDNQNNTACSQHKITTTKKAPLLDLSPSPCSPLPQSDLHHDRLPLTYMDDMIHSNNNNNNNNNNSDENEDDDDEENASTSTLSLSTNRTAATTINDDDDDHNNEEDMKTENEFLRSELVKTKVDNFEKQQYCEKLEQEVDNLQSRLDMMNEGQLNLADKLVAMKSDMDELLQKMKQRELSWNDLKKENEDLAQKILKLSQHQSSTTNYILEEQQQCHNKSELLLLDDDANDNESQPDNLILSTTKKEQDKIHDHSFVNNNNNNNNNNTLGKSGSLYGRMWHVLSPKSHSLKISQ